MGTVEMKVSQLTTDPITSMPILVLRDEGGGVELSIWIGLVEASAIASELEKIPLQRPMTHDLIKILLGHCGARLVRVEIYDVRDTTFFSSLLIERAPGEAPVKIDARPSDAIALAMRTGSPIHVARKVLRRPRRSGGRASGIVAAPTDDGPEAQGAWPSTAEAIAACGGESIDSELQADLLESLADEDFGKWKM